MLHKQIKSLMDTFKSLPKSTILTPATSDAAKSRIIRTGTVIKIISGKESSLCGLGDVGKIHHTCEYSGFRYITLKKHRKDPVYCDYAFGPFSDIELEAVS